MRDLEVPVLGIATSVALLIVAEAFRRGSMLADDLDSLV